jgi:hypothetical protein
MTHAATIEQLRAIAFETTLLRRDGYSPGWMKSGWDPVRHPDVPGVRWRLRRGHDCALVVPSRTLRGAWIVSTTRNPAKRRYGGLRIAMDAAMADVATAGDAAAPQADGA